MIKAKYSDKKRVVEILARSFDDNKSVNYIIKQDKKRITRIRSLVEYSFDMCYFFGNIFLTGDRNGCALILLPDKKRTTVKSVLAEIKLIINCTGLSNLPRAISREAKIKKLHPGEPMYYLWFLGVDPANQNKGTGSALLKEVIKHAHSLNRCVYLETSTMANIPWYEKFGFKIYNELDLGYRLYFMKKE